MKIASSFLKKAKGVRLPLTNKTVVNVMWPPTDKVKSVPISKPLSDGSLHIMQFWVYDEATSTVVIRMEKTQIRLIDLKDLLKFGEHDIKKLASKQIMTDNLIFEPAAKAFTLMGATIVDKRLWAGALEDADVHLVVKS